jgi:hypothetical protein
MYQNNGSFSFRTAGSGVAGSAISWCTGMYISSIGKVGIGLTTPCLALSVGTTNYPQLAIVDTDKVGQGAYWYFQNSDGGFYIGNATDTFATNSDKISITTAGDVSISCGLTAKTLGTNDLLLNNLNYECANYVDGTRGSWLIQEGACDLFIINQVSCKKYKFNLIEIK